MQQNAGTIQMPECCSIDDIKSASSLLGEFISSSDNTWLKLGASIILAGQSMVWGLAVNLSEIAAFSTVYWILHGILASSALLVVAINGTSMFRRMVDSLIHRKLGIETLFATSLLGAFGGSLYATFSGVGEVYYEVVIVVMIIYTFGQRLGKISKKQAIEHAQKFREQFENANKLNPDHTVSTIPVCMISDQDTIVVYPGQPITMDGVIIEGRGFVKETPLTGEPHPMVKTPGDSIRAGTFSVDATLHFRPNAIGEIRMIDKILEGVERSISNTQSIREVQAHRWIQYFVMFVAAAAVLTGASWWYFDSAQTAWIRTMSVLLIACPCALGIATPVGVWTGLWKIASVGLTSRSAILIDVLAKSRHYFFDKTGTLTHASLDLGQIVVLEQTLELEQIIAIGAELEAGIEHPIARAFEKRHRSETNARADPMKITTSKWIQGCGVEAECVWTGESGILRMGTPLWAGSATKDNHTQQSKTLALSFNSKILAEIELVETLRAGVDTTLSDLRKQGAQTTILTGDPHPAWSEISGARILSGLTPEDKARLVSAAADRGDHPVFIGDGINDLDAMHASAASISIHDGGSLLAQSDSDAILSGHGLSALPVAISIAKSIDRTLRSNLKIAACYNVVGISLAALGVLHPVASALIMIASSLTVTYRAIWLSKIQ